MLQGAATVPSPRSYPVMRGAARALHPTPGAAKRPVRKPHLQHAQLLPGCLAPLPVASTLCVVLWLTPPCNPCNPHTHPSLCCRYAETVIYRIFYKINKLGSGRMSYRELKRSDLLDALFALEREEDINRVTRYFSYEHFYVIYCKFWELDTDHDFLLDKSNLARYSNCGLTYKIVDRIFQEVSLGRGGGEGCAGRSLG